MNTGDSDVQDQMPCRQIPKVRKLRSSVWNHMTRQHSGDGSYIVFCNHCKRKMHTTGTTNLKSHLKFCDSFRHSKSGQTDVKIDENETNMPVKGSFPNSSRRRNRSAVWNDMTKEHRGDGSYFATCNHCKKRMVGSSAKGTTHLRNHLRFCHAFRQSKGNPADAGQMLLEQKEKRRRWENSTDFLKFDPERSRQDFVHMLILHGYPISFVDHIGFRMFLKNLQPLFELTPKCSILADCMKFYECERNKLLEVLARISSRISLTASVQTTVEGMHYLSLTSHFIDDDWKLQERMLNLVNVKSLHDFDELTEVIKDKISDWHISGKLLSFVLGYPLGSNAAITKLLGQWCFWSEPVSEDNFCIMHCFARRLDDIVLQGLNAKCVNSIIEGIRRIVRHTMKCQTRKISFYKCVQQLGAPEKELVLDTPKRWSSTYLMLETSLEFKNVFTQLPDSSYSALTVDWGNVQAIVDCLSLFYELTSRFYDKKYSTINFCFVDLCFIHMKLKEWHDSSSQCLKSMTLEMLEKLRNYWDEANVLPAIASILDPRFKMKSIDYVFSQIYSDNIFEAYKRVGDIRQSLTKLYERYVLQYECIVSSGASHTTTHDGSYSEGEQGKPAHPSNRNLLKLMHKGLGRLLREASKVQAEKTDIDLYLEEGVITVEDEDFSVLNWWMQHVERYPVLSMMARDILAVPLSGFASMSDVGTSLNQRLGCLDATVVEGLLCAQHWLKSEIKGSLQCESEDSLSTIFADINVYSNVNEGNAC